MAGPAREMRLLKRGGRQRMRRRWTSLCKWWCTPCIDRIFSVIEATAHRYLQERRDIGKVLLGFEKRSREGRLRLE